MKLALAMFIQVISDKIYDLATNSHIHIICTISMIKISFKSL